MNETALYKDFNGVEVLKARYHKRAFSKHTHEGYTLACIDVGAQRFFRTGCHFVAGKGSMVLINADQVHTGQAETDYGWCYQAVYPTPEFIHSICKEVMSNSIPYFSLPVIDDPIVSQSFQHFFNSFHQQAPLLQIESLLHTAIIGLVSRYSQSKPTVRDLKDHPVSIVHDYLHSYFNEDISLETLARLTGLGTFSLIRQFKKNYGLAPHAYQVQLRIKHAQKMLQTGITVADAAVSAGFHDQSHLHRHFLRAIGVPPGKYRAMRNNVQAC
jgi:AraC-like DNA-binding protein